MAEAAPPLGVNLHVDTGERADARGVSFWARVRWTDPVTGQRVSRKHRNPSRDAVTAWIERMERAARTGVDSGQTLATYVADIGDRWARGIDPTSTYDPYSAGLTHRVLPTLGHLPVTLLSAGLVDRAIDEWEELYSRSTVKNSVAALVLVLDEAVRDGLVVRNPARDRARRRTVGRPKGPTEPSSPRDMALPSVAVLERLVARVIEVGNHPCYGDVVTVLATTALRISEVAGLRVGDVDLAHGLLHVSRQTYPGRGGLVTKTTMGRRRRTVPIIEPLRPTLARLTVDRDADARLILGPRGASSPRRRCATPRSGTRSSPSSGSRGLSATACGTRP